MKLAFLPIAIGLLSIALAVDASKLNRIPNAPKLAEVDEKYLAAFEVVDDKLVGKHVRDSHAAALGMQCWERIAALFPLSYRKLLVQFNIMSGSDPAGVFDGNGTNDVGRRGYRLSIAKSCAERERDLANPYRAVTPRRGTTDWTLVHEIGHYICLRGNVIELFSQSFDGDDVPQPTRREKPDDYPEDGAPRLDGNFVTSYAERTPGDEEVVETFTTYVLVDELPSPDDPSLVARKLRFFDTIPGMPELRRHIRAVEDRAPERRRSD